MVYSWDEYRAERAAAMKAFDHGSWSYDSATWIEKGDLIIASCPKHGAQGVGLSIDDALCTLNSIRDDIAANTAVVIGESFTRYSSTEAYNEWSRQHGHL